MKACSALGRGLIILIRDFHYLIDKPAEEPIKVRASKRRSLDHLEATPTFAAPHHNPVIYYSAQKSRCVGKAPLIEFFDSHCAVE